MDTGTQDRPDWRTMSSVAGLDERELRAGCVRRRYARGEVVFHEGDPVGALHLLDRGRVAVRLTTLAGDVAIVDVLGVGDTFGEQALVDGIGERTATIVALEKVETLSLARAGFEQLRADRAGVDRFLLMVVAARLRSTSQRLLDALYLPADVRVIRCAWRMYETFRSDHGETVPLTQAELASMAGVTRTTANRVLRQAEQDGLVALARANLTVRDVGGLRRAARA